MFSLFPVALRASRTPCLFLLFDQSGICRALLQGSVPHQVVLTLCGLCQNLKSMRIREQFNVLTSVNYKDFSYCENMIIFTYEEKFGIFTCEDINDVIHVCAIRFTKFIKFNCWTNLNVFLYDQNIFKDCSETFDNLWWYSEISGHRWKFLEIGWKCLYWTSDSVQGIFKNLWQSSENVREIFGTLLKTP